MSPVSIALISLRGVALALDLQGQTRTAGALFTLADAAEAGRNVDAHMALVAEKLKNRASTDEDWADVAQRIEEDSERLQAAKPQTG